MQREFKKEVKIPYTVELIKTFFGWNRCKICGREFRREQGWLIKVLSQVTIYRGYGAIQPFTTIYVCCKCKPNIESATLYAKSLYKPRPPRKD